MEARINRLANAAEVFAFIFGPPTEPGNEESKALVAQLRRLGILFSCFDFSAANEVREALPSHFGLETPSVDALLCIRSKVRKQTNKKSFFFFFLSFMF